MTQDPDRAIGLLEQIAETAMDDDYYVVRADSKREFSTVLTGSVFAVFALLVAVAAVQTRNDRPATERERASLIINVDNRQKQVTIRQREAQSLRREVAALGASADRTDPAYETLRMQTGDSGATGPGVTITVNPNDLSTKGPITDNDLQLLVNGLWYAGAESIAINGNRISTLTAIRTAGPAITVNFRSIGPPFVVVALGNKDTLGPRFIENPGGRYLAARRDDAGIQFSVASSSQLSVPAVPTEHLMLNHAQAIEGAR